jgi:OmpA-OmpF porin, OOP family
MIDKNKNNKVLMKTTHLHRHSNPQPHPYSAIAAGIAVALLAHTSAAQAQGQLTAPAARITDRAIASDYQGYQTQQSAIQALNNTGQHALGSYGLAKAQCWLDVSFHEYTRNDRSDFVQAAMTESQRITQFLSGSPVAQAAPAVNGTSGSQGAPLPSGKNPANQTLLVNNAQRLRADLWDAAHAYKTMPGYGGPAHCAEQAVACAEVELAHAGNEINQQGWRHARPYIQLAEDYLTTAKAAMAQCAPLPAPLPAPMVYAPPPAPVFVEPPPPVVITVQAPPPPPVVITLPAPPPQIITLPAPPPVVITLPAPPPVVIVTPASVELIAEVLFNFDKRDLANVKPYTLNRLNEIVGQIKSGEIVLKTIDLIGHADRSNNTGKLDYNQILAQDRVNVMKAYLVQQGLPAELINTDAKADTMQVESCQAKFTSKQALEECLLPNRRVQVRVLGTRKPAPAKPN